MNKPELEIVMAMEHAHTHTVHKPWGAADLRPWNDVHHDGELIGEIWFQRSDDASAPPSLLLKILFTQEALSIQVHPDDDVAHSMGLENGKTEAWYVLSATKDARVAIGLNERISASALRSSIEDGSISNIVRWQPVSKGDAIYVPAGTIHAIGGGLVLAEIQQRSDTTFRLFDHGRQRELHADSAVAAATSGPADIQSAPRILTDARTLLVASPYFVLERVELPARSQWMLHAEHETWLLVIDGHARIGTMNAFVGEAIFLESEDAIIKAGADGLKCLVAYAEPRSNSGLIHEMDMPTSSVPAFKKSPSPFLQQATTVSSINSIGLRS